MRLIITFKMSKDEMPTDYRFACVSFIKHLLSHNYPNTFEKLYNESCMKTMTFCLYMPRASLAKDYIKVPSQSCRLIISSADNKLLYELYNAAIKERGKPYRFPQELDIVAVSARFEPDYNATKSSVCIKFISPLLVRDHKQDNTDDYLAFDSPDFSKYLNISIQNLFESVGKPYGGVELTPLDAKTTSVSLRGRFFRANLGKFLLSSAPEDINFLYKTGIGSRRSLGFGMFEIIRENS